MAGTSAPAKRAGIGASSLPGEAFDEVFSRPVLTPALRGAAAVGFVAVRGRVNRPPKATRA